MAFGKRRFPAKGNERVRNQASAEKEQPAVKRQNPPSGRTATAQQFSSNSGVPGGNQSNAKKTG